MALIIKIIAVVFILFAILLLWKPAVLNRIWEFFKYGRRVYLAAVIRLVLGIVFLIGAFQCRHFWPITAFGLFFIIGGLLIFMIGQNKIRSIINWCQRQSSLLHRFMALIVLAVGAIILYAA